MEITKSVMNTIMRWSKKKTQIVLLVHVILLILIIPSKSSIKYLEMLYVGIILIITLYARTMGIKKTKKQFDKYKSIWNYTFNDNSFDNYFKFNDIFDFRFDEHFNSMLNFRIFNEECKKRFNNNDNYIQQPSTSLKYFGYKSLNEITPNDLKQKYRKKLIKVHPDNGGTQQETTELITHYNRLKCLL